MEKDNALWLIAQVLSAASLSMEEAIATPNNRDLPLARELAAKCGATLRKHEISVFAITERGSKVELPASEEAVRGVYGCSKIMAERFGEQSDIDIGTVRQYSDQLMPRVWERSELRSALEKAFRLVG